VERRESLPPRVRNCWSLHVLKPQSTPKTPSKNSTIGGAMKSFNFMDHKFKVQIKTDHKLDNTNPTKEKCKQAKKTSQLFIPSKPKPKQQEH